MSVQGNVWANAEINYRTQWYMLLEALSRTLSGWDICCTRKVHDDKSALDKMLATWLLELVSKSYSRYEQEVTMTISLGLCIPHLVDAGVTANKHVCRLFLVQDERRTWSSHNYNSAKILMDDIELSNTCTMQTHLACTAHHFPGFLWHMGARMQFVGNPLWKEQLLKLTTWETLHRIANEIMHSSCQSIQAFIVCKAALDKLQDSLRMLEEQSS